MGPLNTRGYCINDNVNNTERVAVGTREFLELCELLESTPLIQINVITSTASSNAAWVNTTNIKRIISTVTGNTLQKSYLNFRQLTTEGCLLRNG
jgi:alpha-L-arabinofuranosidase